MEIVFRNFLRVIDTWVSESINVMIVVLYFGGSLDWILIKRLCWDVLVLN